MVLGKKIAAGIACLRRSIDPQPIHVQWFLTRECNYKCRTCQIWREPPLTEATTDEVKLGVDTLHDMRVVELVFTGGNPLLRRDIETVLKYAHEKFPLVSIYDNGSLAYKKTQALRHVDKVCISLNTLDPHLQNEMCGVRNAFSNALRSIYTLKEKDIGVAVSLTISDANMKEVPDMIDFFAKRDIPVNLSLYSDISFEDSLVKIGVDDAYFKLKSTGEMLSLLNQLKAFKKRYPIYIDLKTIDSLEKLFESGERDWFCNALGSFFTVNERAEVSGCHVAPPICKVWELPALWESPRIADLRRKYSQCEKCLYLCYITYSHLKAVRDLVGYFWDYEYHFFRKIVRG